MEKYNSAGDRNPGALAMQPNEFSKRRAGRLVKHGRGYWAFVPSPLPPELELTWELAGEFVHSDYAGMRCRGAIEMANTGVVRW